MLQLFRNTSPFGPVAWGPINRLDSLFNTLAGDDGGAVARAWSGPPVAVWEDNDHIHIEVELPGVREEDLDMTVHNGMLFIRGERKSAEGREYLYNGRTYGRFERIITLPEAVSNDDVQATLTNGVLSVDLPKAPEAKPKKISLKTG